MRRRPQPSELTSLIDVLFILVFAALVSTANAVKKEAQATAALPVPVVHKPASSFEVIRKEAVGKLTSSLERRPAVHARISRDGVLDAVQFVDEAGDAQVVTLASPLIERIPDPDIALAYLGDASPEQRVCSIVRRAMGKDDLAGMLVVLVPAVGLGELPYALVRGLESDVDRCFVDARALAVLVDPMWPIDGAPMPPGTQDGGAP